MFPTFRLAIWSLIVLGSAFYSANASERQLEFGGVKLGTKASALGFKLDDYRAYYIWKKKFSLMGYFAQPGHPVFSIKLMCDKADAGDQLEGIKCGDSEAKLLNSSHLKVEPRCSTHEASDWETQNDPYVYVDQETNRVWYVHYKTREVSGFGIASANNEWAPCVRAFSDEEIAKIKLGSQAKAVLKENFRNTYLGYAYLRKGIKVKFDPAQPDPRIEKIEYDCDGVETTAPKNKLRLDCGAGADVMIRKYGNSIVRYCDAQTLKTIMLYRPQSQEYWSVWYNGEIYAFGSSEKPNLPECNKFSAQLRLIEETKSRKPNSAPLPLVGEKGVFRIKGISLGDGPSVCPKIETVSFTNQRINLNICLIEDGDNYTRVYFDQTKSFVVKVERIIFNNAPDELLSDALRFYNNELIEKETWTYEFGDLNTSRGFRLVKWSCFLFSNKGCDGSEAKYRFSFTMVDSGAFLEAAGEGRRAYREKEF